MDTDQKMQPCAVKFLSLCDKDRLKLVETAENPREVLAGVPATEVWFTIMRLTPADALPLIKYSTTEQLQTVFDIEWWKKDRLDAASIYEWMNYIEACGIEKTVEWFKEFDWDQILWFFKTNIVVFKKEDKEEDPSDAIGWPREEMPITHEGIYYFQVLNEKRDQTIRRALEILVKHDMELYRSICEACIWDIPSQREEDAQETRSRRLAEHGFPPFDEAIQVYSPISRARFKMVEKRKGGSAEFLAPQYPLTVLGDRVLFINRVVSLLSEGEKDRFLLEAAQIANKILVADGEGIDCENISSSLLKAMGLINIGLEVMSDGDLSTAAKLIPEHWLISFFQVGLGEVMKLSADVKKTFKESWMGGNKKSLVLIDADAASTIERLIQKRPTGFMSSDEIARSRSALYKTEFIGRILKELFLKDMNSLYTLLEYPEDLKLTGVLITIFINGALKAGWVFKPVSIEGLGKFLKIADLSSGETRLDKIVGDLGNFILSKLNGLTAEEKGFLNSYTEAARERFIDEFKGVSDVPESRYVNSVWLK